MSSCPHRAARGNPSGCRSPGRRPDPGGPRPDSALPAPQMAADGADSDLEEQLKDVGARLQEAPDDSDGLLKLLYVSLLSQLCVFILFGFLCPLRLYVGFVVVVVSLSDDCNKLYVYLVAASLDFVQFLVRAKKECFQSLVERHLLLGTDMYMIMSIYC